MKTETIRRFVLTLAVPVGAMYTVIGFVVLRPSNAELHPPMVASETASPMEMEPEQRPDPKPEIVPRSAPIPVSEPEPQRTQKRKREPAEEPVEGPSPRENCDDYSLAPDECYDEPFPEETLEPEKSKKVKPPKVDPEPEVPSEPAVDPEPEPSEVVS